MDCCCSGGCNTELKTEEEKCGEYQSAAVCRDAHFQHPVRTKACEALAKLPLTMPLYSGYKNLLFLQFLNCFIPSIFKERKKLT